jgi:hypothetical protein
MSMTQSASQTFNLADAKRLASKVIADMHQCQLLYKSPSDVSIALFNEELIVLLHGGYVKRYEFGFQTASDQRVVSWQYQVSAAGNLEGGRSGGLYAKANISAASWFNFLWYSDKWTTAARNSVEGSYQLNRVAGEPPSDGSGRWVNGAAYVSGGVAAQRKEFQPW